MIRIAITFIDGSKGAWLVPAKLDMHVVRRHVEHLAKTKVHCIERGA